MKKKRFSSSAVQRFTVAVVLALWAGSAWAGWSTNWPAWQFPSAGVYHAQDCYSAVVERCQAAGVAAPSTNVFFDAQYANLVALKAKVKDLVPYYVATNQANAEGNFTNWFTVGVEDFPRLTVTGLCVQLKIPTNYFEFTPYDGLCGLGGFEDDAGVGHPRGWTNASTVAGGSVYPDGRSNVWFTTDFGWEGLQEIVNELRWTKGQSYWVHEGGTRISAYNPYFAAWTDALANATNGATAPFSRNIFGWNARYWTSGYQCQVYFLQYATNSAINIPTQLGHSVDFYMRGWAFPYSTIPLQTYTDWGMGIGSNQFCLSRSSSEQTNATVEGITFNAAKPPDMVEPPYNASFSGRGFWLGEETYASPIPGDCVRVLIKWDGANGFQYK